MMTPAMVAPSANTLTAETSWLTSAVMYHLLKNPSSLAKLKEEVDAAAAEGRLSRYVTWKESKELPYLDACVKEATRMHPPFALPFERVIPEGGLEVDGHFIPSGTRVGIVRTSRVLTIDEKLASNICVIT